MPQQLTKQKLFTCTAILACTIFCTNAAAQNFENPAEYMKYIISQHDEVTDKFLRYNSAVFHGKKAAKVEKLKQKLLKEVEESKANISKMPPFKTSSAYRDTAASFLQFYHDALNDNYGRIVNLDEIADQSYDEVEALLLLQEKIGNKLEKANERMQAAQKTFSSQNNILLTDAGDELREKMKVVEDVNEHYHEVFIIFFKPYLQEKNLNKAIQKGNIKDVEKARANLLKYAQDALLNIKSVKPYESDSILLKACKKMMQYYEQEANSSLKPVTDYFLLKEKFDITKSRYESKKMSTQTETDAYNKAVDDINIASDKYNLATRNIYNTGQENLKQWNKSLHIYFDRYMPE